MTTRELIERLELAATYAEDGARETAIRIVLETGDRLERDNAAEVSMIRACPRAADVGMASTLDPSVPSDDELDVIQRPLQRIAGPRAEVDDGPARLTADNLGWATNGTLRSRDHLAVVEPYQNRALCGVAIPPDIGEIRPRTLTNLCPKCEREARKLRIDPSDVGIENDLETVVRWNEPS